MTFTGNWLQVHPSSVSAYIPKPLVQKDETKKKIQHYKFNASVHIYVIMITKLDQLPDRGWLQS
jgi:hypothetical protein